MMNYYTATVAIAVAVCATMMVVLRDSAVLARREKRLFIHLFLAVAVGSLCEWGAVVLDGAPAVAWLVIPVLKVVEFSFAPALGVVFASIIENHVSQRIERAYGLLALNALVEILLAPLGVVFYVDAAGVYRHGPAYAIYIVSYAASVIFLLHETRRFAASFQYRGRLLPWLILALLAGGLVVQAALDIRIIWLMIAIAGVFFYLFYCSVTMQTDALTGLLNRMSYETAISVLADRAVFVLIDVDSFKQVNDTYGHQVGDRALTVIGRAIAQTYGGHGTCYRYGGDEFCAILTKDYLETAGLNRALCHTLEEERSKFPALPTVSIGYAFFDPASSNKADAIAEADAMMYRFKEARDRVQNASDGKGRAPHSGENAPRHEGDGPARDRGATLSV